MISLQPFEITDSTFPVDRGFIDSQSHIFLTRVRQSWFFVAEAYRWAAKVIVAKFPLPELPSDLPLAPTRDEIERTAFFILAPQLPCGIRSHQHWPFINPASLVTRFLKENP